MSDPNPTIPKEGGKQPPTTVNPEDAKKGQELGQKMEPPKKRRSARPRKSQ